MWWGRGRRRGGEREEEGGEREEEGGLGNYGCGMCGRKRRKK